MKFIVLPTAAHDLDRIWDYLLQQSSSSVVASRWIDRIEEAFSRIAAHPMIGRQRNELGLGLRSIVVGNYVLFYRNRESIIEIVRVIHGRRDFAKIHI